MRRRAANTILIVNENLLVTQINIFMVLTLIFESSTFRQRLAASWRCVLLIESELAYRLGKIDAAKNHLNWVIVISPNHILIVKARSCSGEEKICFLEEKLNQFYSPD